MKKIKIGRNSFIIIQKEDENIDYQKWIIFIENHKNFFIWYEDTEDGKKVMERIDEFSDRIKRGILYKLNRTNVYCTKELSKNSWDCIISYNTENNISVHLEKKITKKIAEILLKMANYLEAKIIIDDKKEFISLKLKNNALNEMFEGRTIFEDIMGYYRYKKADGWAHTSDIADNFKGVDFYKDFFELDNVISTKKAVSMKTTKVKDVKQWLISENIKKNIRFLKETFKPEGLQSNGKILKVTESAEIHIYMPRENITDDLLKTWQKELSKKTRETGIKFEIRALEDFIK